MTQFIERLSDPHLIPTHDDCLLFADHLRSLKTSTTSLARTPRIAGIYGLIVKDKIVYVGRSVNAYFRIREHRGRKRFDSVGVVPVRPSALSLVEFRLIRELKPPYNSTHVDRRNSWGTLTVDEIADTLNVTPGDILDVCLRQQIPIRNLLVDIKQVLWHFSRR